jgi:hypothetical protein
MKNYTTILKTPFKIILGIGLGLIFSFVTIVCLEMLLPKPNPFRKEGLNLWLVGPIIAGWLFLMLWMLLRKPSLKKIQTQGIENLPTSVSSLIDAIIDIMRYRKSVRAEVRQELTDHFTDALTGFENEHEKQQRIQELVEEFGDPEVLGMLLRRAKKRCRPLWRTLVVRAFQLLGICFLLLIVHFVYLSFAAPNIEINYVEKTTRLSQLVTDESKNAAVWYQKAIDAYQPPEAVFNEATAVEIKKLDTHGWVTELTTEQSALLEQWYTANAEAYAYLFKGTELPYCWWEYDYDKSQTLYSMVLPKYQNLRELLVLLCWQAKQESVRGNYQTAFERLQKTYRFGMHFKGPKTLIEQILGVGIQNYAMQANRQIISHCAVPLGDITTLRKTILALFQDDTFIADLETEKFAMLDFIQRLYTDNGHGQGVLIPRQLIAFNRHADFFDVLEVPVLSEGFSYGASLVSADRENMTQEVERLYDRIEDYIRKTPYEQHTLGYIDPVNELWNNTTLYHYRYWPIFMFTPAVSKIGEITYRSRCNVQATITILAVIQYQKEYGQYPDTLDKLLSIQLLSEAPLDPFSNEPLVYRKTEDGFKLYSVGANFVDDGGIPATTDGDQPDFWGENGDTVFWPVSKSQK